MANNGCVLVRAWQWVRRQFQPNRSYVTANGRIVRSAEQNNQSSELIGCFYNTETSRTRTGNFYNNNTRAGQAALERLERTNSASNSRRPGGFKRRQWESSSTEGSPSSNSSGIETKKVELSEGSKHVEGAMDKEAISGSSNGVLESNYATNERVEANKRMREARKCCGALNCREKLGALNTMTCTECDIDFCIKHRHPDDHQCKGKCCNNKGGFRNMFRM